MQPPGWDWRWQVDAGAGAGSNNSATPPVIVNQEALPDGVRLLLQFGEGDTAAGTLTRDIRLIHP